MRGKCIMKWLWYDTLCKVNPCHPFFQFCTPRQSKDCENAFMSNPGSFFFPCFSTVIVTETTQSQPSEPSRLCRMSTLLKVYWYLCHSPRWLQQEVDLTPTKMTLEAASPALPHTELSAWPRHLDPSTPQLFEGDMPYPVFNNTWWSQHKISWFVLPQQWASILVVTAPDYYSGPFRTFSPLN